MRNLVLSAVMAMGLTVAAWNLPAAQAQYGHHGHCHTGGYGANYGGYNPGYANVYGGGYGGYSSGYGGYSSGYGSYRNVPPVVLGQIYSAPVVRSLPYNNNFGGYYGSGYSGMGYSNFGTGMGYGYGPSISIGVGGFRPRF